MATTTNYGWTTPDDTALVKDGASAIRTLGSSIDSTLKTQIDAQIPDSLLTTTGDTIYASGASTPARLGIGTTGQVLTVSGGLPAWATPGGAGSNYSLLNAGGTALTGAQTITVSGISGKDSLYVLFSNVSSASAASQIALRINTDTAANYSYYGFQLEVGSTYSTNIGNVTSAGSSTFHKLFKMSSNAASSGYGYAIINGANTSGVKMIQSGGSSLAAGGNAMESPIHAGLWNNTSTITSISLYSETGNFDSGTFWIYASA